MKFLYKYIDQDTITNSLAFALIYCVICNSSVVYYKITHDHASALNIALTISKDIILNTIFLFIFFFGFALHKILFQICSFLLFLLGGIASYHIFFHEKHLSLNLIRSLYGHSILEMHNFISIRLIVWVIAALGICYLSIRHFKISTPSQFFTKMISIVCLFFFINCIISPTFIFLEEYYPIQFLNNIYKYFL